MGLEINLFCSSIYIFFYGCHHSYLKYMVGFIIEIKIKNDYPQIFRGKTRS